MDTSEPFGGLTLGRLHKFSGCAKQQEDKRDSSEALFGKIEQEEVSLPEK